jgi:serralysin
VGQITTLSHVAQTIPLNHTYVDPVVFAQPASIYGQDTSVVRLTNVQPDSFTLYVHEAPDKDGPHAAETVSYLVLEAGQWALPNGTLVHVGHLDTAATVGLQIANQWQPVNFNSSFSTGPVVISQVQGDNDSHWVKTRQRNVLVSGFEVALEEDEAQTTSHGTETIGWLAVEAGQGVWDGHNYEFNQTANAVTHSWYQVTFGQSFGQTPRFIATIGTYDGADNSGLRYTNLTTAGVQIKIEEDTTLDSETGHTTEVVHFLTIEGDGTLTASPQ